MKDEFVNKEDWQINTHILNERWNEVDDKLSTFYSKNQKINKKMYDKLQSVFDGIDFEYNELNNYASTSNIVRLRTRIEELKDEYGLEGYIGYELEQYSRKKKLRNKDLLLALLMIEYYRQYKEQNELEEELFDQIKQLVYRQATIETITILKKKVPKKVPEIDKQEWINILLLATYTGFNWLDYKMGNLGYNIRKLYETVLIQLQKGKKINIQDDEIKKVLNRQEKAYINYTEESEKTTESEKHKFYKNKFSGSLDNYIAVLTNQLVLKAIKNNGGKYVKFVATLDSRTTEMCISLDGQIFKIDGINKFYRYSDEDKKKVLYTTYGLESGANLPPINNHYHHCRSTIQVIR